MPTLVEQLRALGFDVDQDLTTGLYSPNSGVGAAARLQRDIRRETGDSPVPPTFGDRPRDITIDTRHSLFSSYDDLINRADELGPSSLYERLNLLQAEINNKSRSIELAIVDAGTRESRRLLSEISDLTEELSYSVNNPAYARQLQNLITVKRGQLAAVQAEEEPNITRKSARAKARMTELSTIIEAQLHNLELARAGEQTVATGALNRSIQRGEVPEEAAARNELLALTTPQQAESAAAQTIATGRARQQVDLEQRRFNVSLEGQQLATSEAEQRAENEALVRNFVNEATLETDMARAYEEGLTRNDIDNATLEDVIQRELMSRIAITTGTRPTRVADQEALQESARRLKEELDKEFTEQQATSRAQFLNIVERGTRGERLSTRELQVALDEKLADKYNIPKAQRDALRQTLILDLTQRARLGDLEAQARQGEALEAEFAPGRARREAAARTTISEGTREARQADLEADLTTRETFEASAAPARTEREIARQNALRAGTLPGRLEELERTARTQEGLEVEFAPSRAARQAEAQNIVTEGTRDTRLEDIQQRIITEGAARLQSETATLEERMANEIAWQSGVEAGVRPGQIAGRVELQNALTLAKDALDQAQISKRAATQAEYTNILERATRGEKLDTREAYLLLDEVHADRFNISQADRDAARQNWIRSRTLASRTEDQEALLASRARTEATLGTELAETTGQARGTQRAAEITAALDAQAAQQERLSQVQAGVQLETEAQRREAQLAFREEAGQRIAVAESTIEALRQNAITERTQEQRLRDKEVFDRQAAALRQEFLPLELQLRNEIANENLPEAQRIQLQGELARVQAIREQALELEQMYGDVEAESQARRANILETQTRDERIATAEQQAQMQARVSETAQGIRAENALQFQLDNMDRIAQSRGTIQAEVNRIIKADDLRFDQEYQDVAIDLERRRRRAMIELEAAATRAIQDQYGAKDLQRKVDDYITMETARINLLHETADRRGETQAAVNNKAQLAELEFKTTHMGALHRLRNAQLINDKNTELGWTKEHQEEIAALAASSQNAARAAEYDFRLSQSLMDTMSALSGRPLKEVRQYMIDGNFPEDQVTGLSLLQRGQRMMDQGNQRYVDILSMDLPDSLKRRYALDWAALEKMTEQSKGESGDDVLIATNELDQLYARAAFDASNILIDEVRDNPTSPLAKSAESRTAAGQEDYRKALHRQTILLFNEYQLADQMMDLRSNLGTLEVPGRIPSARINGRDQAIREHILQSDEPHPMHRLADAAYELAEAEGTDVSNYGLVVNMMLNDYLEKHRTKSNRYAAPITRRELQSAYDKRMLERVMEQSGLPQLRVPGK